MKIRVVQQEVVLNHGKNLTLDKFKVDDEINLKDTEEYSKAVARDYAAKHNYKDDDLVVYLVYTEKM